MPGKDAPCYLARRRWVGLGGEQGWWRVSDGRNFEDESRNEPSVGLKLTEGGALGA